MNIEEKVLQLKQDFNDVYKAGQESGGGGSYEQGYEDGKNSVVRLENYVKNMQFHNLNDFGTEIVELVFEKVTSLAQMFSNVKENGNEDYWGKNTTVKHLIIRNKAIVTNIYRMFYNDNSSTDTTLNRITFDFDLSTEYSVNASNLFRNMSGLEIIDGKPLNVSKCTSFSQSFNGVANLREIRFVPETINVDINFSVCKKLSNDSKQSIFDGLAPVDTAQTLTLHNDVKILQSQVDSANAKGWTVAGGTVVSEEEYNA